MPGAQYACGTTDVTRTFHLGAPTAWQRECYTRVLKGNINLDSAVFPEGTPGMAIDAFARKRYLVYVCFELLYFFCWDNRHNKRALSSRPRLILFLPAVRDNQVLEANLGGQNGPG